MPEENYNSNDNMNGDDVAEKFLSSQEANPEEASRFRYNPGDTESVLEAENEAQGSTPAQNKLAGNLTSKLFTNGKIKKTGPITLFLIAILGGGSAFLIGSAPFSMMTYINETLSNSYINTPGHMNSRRRLSLSANIMDPDVPGGTKTKTSFFLKKTTRYSTVSNSQLARLQSAGFDIKSTETTFGRQRIDSISIANNDGIKMTPLELDAAEFKTTINNNIELNTKWNKAMRGTVGTKADAAFNKVKSILGLITDGTRSFTRTSTDADGDTTRSAVDKLNDGIDDANSSVRESSDINSNIDPDKVPDGYDAETTKSNLDSLDANLNKPTTFQKASKIIGGLGLATLVSSSVCGGYNLIQKAVLVHKVNKAIDAAKVASLFMSEADRIKLDGEDGLSEEEISALGDRYVGLGKSETSSYLAPSGVFAGLVWAAESDLVGDDEINSIGTAADAIGIKAISDPSSVRTFLGDSEAQVAQIGASEGMAKTLESYNNENLNEFCGTFNNIMNSKLGFFLNAASLAFTALSGGSIVAGLFKVGTELGSDQIAGMVIQSVAASIGSAIIGSMGGGIFDRSMTPNLLGNALAAGSSYTFSQTAMANGGGTMTKEDAKVTMRSQRDMIALNAEMIRRQKSPFDTSTSYTFMGNIMANLMPYSVKTANFFSRMQTIASIGFKSFGSILPGSQALAYAEAEAGDEAYLSACKDPILNEMGVATDPMCVPIIGIPDNAYEHPAFTPDAVVNYLAAPENIDNFFVRSPEGCDPSKDEACELKINNSHNSLKTYLDECVDRETSAPIGYDNGDNAKDGKYCQLSSLAVADTGGPIGKYSGTDIPKYNYSPEAEKVLSAIYFLDENIQCRLDEGENCQLEGQAANYTSLGSSSSAYKGVLPVKSTSITVTSEWGQRCDPLELAETGKCVMSFHDGVDLATTTPTPIIAFMPGVVKATGIDTVGGVYVIIEHTPPDGKRLASKYFHLAEGSVKVKVGDIVNQSMEIATMGATGSAQTGLHLHFSIYSEPSSASPTDSVNPWTYMDPPASYSPPSRTTNPGSAIYSPY